jgi:hypothetical protein
MDVANYVDYLLLYHWVGETDWPHNNWVCARANDAPNPPALGSDLGRFRFFPTSSEIGFHLGDSGAVSNDYIQNHLIVAATSAYDSVSTPFSLLRGCAAFRTDFRDRITKHFLTPGGVFYSTGTTSIAFPCKPFFSAATADFRKVWYGESARWGDLRTEQTYGPENTGNSSITAHWTSVETAWLSSPATTTLGYQRKKVLENLTNYSLAPP